NKRSTKTHSTNESVRSRPKVQRHPGSPWQRRHQHGKSGGGVAEAERSAFNSEQKVTMLWNGMEDPGPETKSGSGTPFGRTHVPRSGWVHELNVLQLNFVA